MRIVGGSFGTKGKFSMSPDGTLTVDGASHAQYKASQIRHLDTRQEKTKKFGFFSALIGVLLLGGIGFAFFGLVGAIAGILLAIVGSYYVKKTHYAEVEFDDGNRLLLEGSARGINLLVKHASGSSRKASAA